MDIKLKNIEDATRDLTFIKKVIVDTISFSHIAESPVHGFGLFADTDINRNTSLGFLDGQIISWDQYDHLSDFFKEKTGKYQNYFFMEWNAIDTKTLLVRPFRTKYSYINHSTKPNLEIKHNPMRLEAIKDIKSGEEYFIDYNKEPLKEEYINGHGKTFL